MSVVLKSFSWTECKSFLIIYLRKQNLGIAIVFKPKGPIAQCQEMVMARRFDKDSDRKINIFCNNTISLGPILLLLARV